MKLEVGKKYRTREGNVVTIIEHKPKHNYPFKSDSGRSYMLYGNQWCRTHESIYDLIEEVTEPTPTHLPARFKLNPGGNEALSKAMQERLFELGIKRMHGKKSSNFEWPWIHFNTHGDGEYYVNTEDTHAIPLLKLDDLYTLQPTPKELPKLEIAGRTLELKNGRVVGNEFDCGVYEFIGTLQTYWNPRGFGNHTIFAGSVIIGCQELNQEDMVRALKWAKEVTKEGAA